MRGPLATRLVSGTVALFLLVGVAACGDDSDDSGDSTDTTEQTDDSSADTAADATAVSSAKVVDTELGEVLADADTGMTLYAFDADTDTNSACTGGCADAWPPLVGPADAGDGIDAAKLGTIVRDDGSEQASYGGHPLYTFSGDSAAGDTNGQGSGDQWFVMQPSGDPLKDTAVTETTSGDRY